MKTSKVAFVSANIAINAAALATLVKDVKNKRGLKKIVKNQLAFTGAAYCTLILEPKVNAHINATILEYIGKNTRFDEYTTIASEIIRKTNQF